MFNLQTERLFRLLKDIPSVELKSRLQIKDIVQRIADEYGLMTAAYLGTGFTHQQRIEPYLAVTYSYNWVEHYKRQQYLAVDPAIQIGLRRLLPVDWDDFERPTRVLRDFFGEAHEFGLGKRGLSIPVHGRFGDRGLFSVTSDLSKREWQRAKLHYMRDFHLLATFVHDQAFRISGGEWMPPRLSPRETECLRWISEGKTAWECAIILGLSEHTVRCYLESARQKLKAVSNTHAVTIAHRTGLLTTLL